MAHRRHLNATVITGPRGSDKCVLQSGLARPSGSQKEVDSPSLTRTGRGYEKQEGESVMLWRFCANSIPTLRHILKLYLAQFPAQPGARYRGHDEREWIPMRPK
jgi:hypothetical protein